MADIPLYDDSEAAPRPPAEVRFRDVALRPYPDGRRMKLSFQLTPFQRRPNVDVTASNAEGDEVAALSLIEAMDTQFDFTVHLRGPEPAGPHQLHLTLFYTEGDSPDGPRQVVDEHTLTFWPRPDGSA